MRTPRFPRSHARAGFTIVEVLVALAILVFGMTAVIGLLTFGAALSKTALLRTSAAAASHAIVADLEETLFPPARAEEASTAAVDREESGAGPPIEIVDRPLPGMPEVVYSARATANPARPIEYRVDVEMTWKSAGVRRATRFSTLLVREVPFGERLRRRVVSGASGEGAESPRTPPPH